MKTCGYIHRFITSFILLSAAAIVLKGFFQPEQTALLLLDTGLVPAMYVEVLAFSLPFALAVCLSLAFFELTSIAPIVVCLALYMLPSGIALYQGLHFDCGCYLPGSLESRVYSELEPQFIIMLVITAITGGLHYFNSHRPIRTKTHLA
ncbi:MauE/DoxX family redox-associated membrane protein [Photobacterium chitinilyticum]|uniref:Methylamine utilization protein MauE n=1 Tax=Photobacterium chitinilyticum TaxID=2485123 RepID=A0A3S3R2T8_9GAMM|nr:MauE/DoxX family redox-associated membrane protein [Photobacterium chitinilyticum]RWX56929.1 hypothetical protein EDI28_02475 [Photobacterium chitinilyticum]